MAEEAARFREAVGLYESSARMGLEEQACGMVTAGTGGLRRAAYASGEEMALVRVEELLGARISLQSDCVVPGPVRIACRDAGTPPGERLPRGGGRSDVEWGRDQA
jgi:hypothetical protein